MRRVFLYEELACGGFAGEELPESLLREGLAMFRAIRFDLEKLDVRVESCLDGRVSRLESVVGVELVDSPSALDDAIRARAPDCDAVWIVAPELENRMVRRRRQFSELIDEQSLLTCGEETLALAADKLAQFHRLRDRGVPCLAAAPYMPGETSDVDRVIKPRSGAGGVGAFRVAAGVPGPPAEFESIATDWSEGDAASVGFVLGRRNRVALRPCSQRISPDFEYIGGAVPIGDLRVERRAVTLAERAVDALTRPDDVGFVGIDLLLGEAAEDDVVVEFNARVTMSYTGLRELTETNLAGLCLDALDGRDMASPDWIEGSATWPT